MLTQVIEKIVAMSAPIRLDIDGKPYASRGLVPLHQPEPHALELETLCGLRDYIETNPDDLQYERLVFHVAHYNEVRLCGPLFGPFEQRKCYVVARADANHFPFERFMEPESFIIKLQSMFIADETTAKILSIVGNIKDERVNTVGDDGITQQVTARAGIARVENIKLPNPVTLTPYRTFLEADQPPSQFVFRMRSGAADGPATAALYEADGGRWKIQAVQNISRWLKENIKAEIQVLA